MAKKKYKNGAIRMSLLMPVELYNLLKEKHGDNMSAFIQKLIVKNIKKSVDDSKPMKPV